MKIAIVGDMHLGFKKSSDVFHKSAIDFVREILIPSCKEHEVNQIVLLGDLFDNRTAINVLTMNHAFDILNEICDVLSPRRLYILVGNHDTYYSTTNKISSLRMFDGYRDDRINIITKPESFGEFTMIPWISPENESECVDAIKNNPGQYVFGHFEIIGGKMNESSVSTHGLSRSVFENSKRVYSGHYHCDSDDDLVNYVGSPYQFNRGDSGADRGFKILDTCTGEEKFILNTVSPRFTKLKFPQKFKTADITGNFVDVYVECDEEGLYDEKLLEKYIDTITKTEPLEKPSVHLLKSARSTDGDFEVDTMNTTSALLTGYVSDYRYKDADESTKQRILKRLMSIYDKARGDNE